MKKYRNAALCNAEALALYKKISNGTDSTDIAKTLIVRGDYYTTTGRESRGREEYRRGLKILMKLEPDNPLVREMLFILS